MKVATQHEIKLGGQRVDYRVVRSAAARKLRLRVGPNGVEVLLPIGRTSEDVSAFMDMSGVWILDQLERAERLRSLRRPTQHKTGEILFRGESTQVRIEVTPARSRGNIVDYLNGKIIVRCGVGSRTPIARSLQNWLRKEARLLIERYLAPLTERLRQKPDRIYVMGQRTKWGNCSPLRNLSFNWRLILAPEFVSRYLVIHEVTHLVVPDHSARFWLTVQGLCPDVEGAKRWLREHESELFLDLTSRIHENGARGLANTLEKDKRRPSSTT